MKQVTLKHNLKEAMGETKAFKDTVTSVMCNIDLQKNNFMIMTFTSARDFLVSQANLTETVYFLGLFP